MFMENNNGARPANSAASGAVNATAGGPMNGSASSSMNGGSSGTQATPSCCPDTNGTLPSCAGLAVPYVPFQQNNAQRYSQSEALSNGTLFPGLNLPFRLAVDGSSLPDTPLAELQALEFVVLELNLYLDTHKDDAEAFRMFQQFSAMEKAARAAYESKYGPVTKQAAASGDSYQWLSDPWPWNYGQNEVK